MLKNMLQYICIIVNYAVYGVIVYCYCISFTSALYLLSMDVGLGCILIEEEEGRAALSGQCSGWIVEVSTSEGSY